MPTELIDFDVTSSDIVPDISDSRNDEIEKLGELRTYPSGYEVSFLELISIARELRRHRALAKKQTDDLIRALQAGGLDVNEIKNKRERQANMVVDAIKPAVATEETDASPVVQEQFKKNAKSKKDD